MPFWMNRALHPRKGDTVIWDKKRGHITEYTDQWWVFLPPDPSIQLRVNKTDWDRSFRYDNPQLAWVLRVTKHKERVNA